MTKFSDLDYKTEVEFIFVRISNIEIVKEIIHKYNDILIEEETEYVPSIDIYCLLQTHYKGGFFIVLTDRNISYEALDTTVGEFSLSLKELLKLLRHIDKESETN